MCRDDSKLILDDLESWLDRKKQQVPPKTALGKAVTYTSNLSPRLIGYLEDGRLALDNNAAKTVSAFL